MTMLQRPPAGTIPDAPGSYQFKDGEGRVIYVGKAKSLRQRLSNYFQSPSALPPRTAQMVATAETVEWIQVRNDVEALMLEYSADPAAQAPVQRAPARRQELPVPRRHRSTTSGPGRWSCAALRRKGVRYFGPYGHAYAIRETLDLLLRTFPVRTCSDNKFAHHQRLGRPCLLFHIEKCSGPCVGEIDKPAYDVLVGELLEFLDGETDTIVKRLETEMREAADELEFERAARLRDRLTSVRKAIERQQMVADRNEDLDVIGIADDDLEAAVQVFFVRKGRVVGRKGFVLDKAEDLTPAQLVEQDPRGPVLRGPAARACRSRCSCPSSPTTPTSTNGG